MDKCGRNVENDLTLLQSFIYFREEGVVLKNLSYKKLL